MIYFLFGAVTFFYTSFVEQITRVSVGYILIELMGCGIYIYSVLVDSAKQFSKVVMLYPFAQ